MILAHLCLCVLLLAGQDGPGVQLLPSPPESVLIVVGVASEQERAPAETLLKLAETPQQLEAQANSTGYKLLRNGSVVYLLPPRCWRDHAPAQLSQFAEMLATVPPRAPYASVRLSPQNHQLLARWFASDSNPFKSREPAPERLLADGYLWWSGIVACEIATNGQRYQASVLLEASPAELPRSAQARPSAPPTAPQSEHTRALPPNSREESLLFSRPVPDARRADLARTYYELVAREYQMGREQYLQATAQLHRTLLNHFGLPEALATDKQIYFSTLPDWLQARIAAELRNRFPNETPEGIKGLLSGATVRARMQPVVMMGGFVNNSFTSYGWGLDDMLQGL